MAAFAEVFKRKEVKYLTSSHQRLRMEEGVAGHMVVDAYGKSRVTSLYYDTPERLLIERSLDKPLYKEKLRVRWYGEAGPDGLPAPDTRVFVELKKKFKGIVYKRRVSCTYAAATEYLAGRPYEEAVKAHPLANEAAQAEALSALSRQIAREIDAFVARHAPLGPSMLISCIRCAYTPVLLEGEEHDAGSQDDVRITFDERIGFRDLTVPDAPWRAVTKPGESVMEVKVAGPYPRWMLDAVSAAEVRPTSFSKYGRAYAIVMESNREARKAQACANECAAAGATRTNVPKMGQKPEVRRRPARPTKRKEGRLGGLSGVVSRVIGANHASRGSHAAKPL